MSQTNDDKKVNSVPYTKAGLADKNQDSGDENKSENKSETVAEHEKSDSTAHTPKISKEKSIERDHERPVH